MMTPNQLALLAPADRIFGKQPVDGYNGEKNTAFICYGCLVCLPNGELESATQSYPHFLTIELTKNLEINR